MNHSIKYILESSGLLFPSRSKSSCWAKLGPEQNSSSGYDVALLRFEMLTLTMGLSLPYLQEQPWQLLHAAMKKELACKEGSSIRWKNPP